MTNREQLLFWYGYELARRGYVMAQVLGSTTIQKQGAEPIYFETGDAFIAWAEQNLN